MKHDSLINLTETALQQECQRSKSFQIVTRL